MGLYAYIVGIITAFLTAFYSWRLLFMTFHGSTHASNDIFNKVLNGSKILALHKGKYFKTSLGMQIDSGAFIKGIESLISKKNIK